MVEDVVDFMDEEEEEVEDNIKEHQLIWQVLNAIAVINLVITSMIALIDSRKRSQTLLRQKKSCS